MSQYFFSEDDLGAPCMLEKNHLTDKQKYKLIAERARSLKTIFKVFEDRAKSEEEPLDEANFHVAMETAKEVMSELHELGRLLYGN